VDVDQRHGLGPGVGQGLGLALVVGQDQLGHVAGHLDQQGVALLGGEIAPGLDGVEQDLDVDLVVGAVDPGRVVDGVGVDPHAGPGQLDAGPLGEAQVAALGHHPAADLGGVDPQGVVGLVAHLGVGLAGRLDVGADAAVEQQVDGGPQDGLDQLGRRQGGDVVAQPQRHPDLGGQRDRLGGPLEDAAAGRQQLGGVVGPGRPGGPEQALALDERRLGIGRRVEEDVHVVEGRHQLELARQQHPVAEHVAGHVTDAHHGDGLGGHVDAQLAEVALDRLPGAAGGDAHLLVVVADRPARGEGVAQPVAVARRHLVGDVGEGRRALVGRHHQVGVVAVVADHPVGRHDLGAPAVVGQVEQPRDEGAVAALDLGGHRGAVLGVGGRLLDHEPALGPGGDDDGVLDHLGLHQAQDLGAEVLAPVRPAEAAPGHRSAPQVHPFDGRRVHPDLEAGPGEGQVGDLVGVELEGQAPLGRAVGVDLEGVGAQRGPDQGEQAAQDAVLVEAGHVVEVGLDQLDQVGDQPLAVAAGGRVGREPGLEQAVEVGGDVGVGGHRRLDVVGAEGGAGLAHVAGVGPQHGDRPPRQPGQEHEAVEPVVLHVTPPDADERLLEQGSGAGDVAEAVAHQPEVVDPPVGLAIGSAREADPVGALVGHPHAQVLEQGQDVGHEQRRPRPVELEPGGPRPALQRLDQVDGDVVVAQALEPVDVVHRHLGRHVGLVAGPEGVAVAAEQGQAPLLAVLVDQVVVQVVGPAAHHPGQSLLQVAGPGRPARQVGVGHVERVDVDDEVQPGQHRLRHPGLVLDALAAQGLGQHLLHVDPGGGVVPVAGQEDEARVVPAPLLAPDEQPHLLALLQVEDAQGDVVEVVLAHLHQLVAGVGGQDGGQVLLGVAAGRQVGPVEHPLHLAPQQRDVTGVRLVEALGVEAEEAPLAGHPARRVEPLDAHVVEVAGPVDGGHGVGLGEVEDHRLAGQAPDLGRQLGEAPRHGVALDRLEDAEPGAGHRHQGVVAVLGGDQVVLAVPEEGEVVVDQPAQEGLDLGQLVVVGAHNCGRRIAGELVGDRAHGPDHGPPVVDRGPHVVEHLQQVAGDLGLDCGVTLAVDLDVDVGHPVDDGVEQPVDAQVVAGQLHADRVDDEGHVVDHDLDRGVGRAPAVVGGPGRVDPGDRRLRGPGLAEPVVGQRRAPDVGRVGPQHVFGPGVLVVEAHEPGHVGGFGAVEAPAAQGHSPLDGLGPGRLGRHHLNLDLVLSSVERRDACHRRQNASTAQPSVGSTRRIEPASASTAR
jgi:hypothetical protein